MVSGTKVTCVPNCCCLPPPSAQRISPNTRPTSPWYLPPPIETVRRVFLDAHSLTSVQLAGYLLAKHWKVSPEYYTMEDYAQLDRALPGDAFLLIGDKVFDYEGRFAYSYDLAAEWKKATRLPFAFAVWIARKGVDPDLTEGLQHALTFGIELRHQGVSEGQSRLKSLADGRPPLCRTGL